ncbi:ABC transporter permease [Aeromicrobium choanae]|uniref:ABC-type dipeptide/oligopeptide/nickel transport system, permease component n=1 Tax=Aeromicrobium choanae TaxID=1736691 RepID=A0A1T4Z315_9ACTN|nr:ABC transporter permease [Aeromicrobium choanae]SKB08447.1 ABC-type dipeptide/oligopeptide/nickel transport system, permease component [Aeromicrobium choanae]
MKSHTPQKPWRKMARAFFRSPTGVLSAIGVLVLIVLVIIGPNGFGPTAVTGDVANAGLGPSSEHWFGTDELGHDVLLRSLAATRLSLMLACAAVLIAWVAGTGIGVLVALSGPRMRRIGSIGIDTLMSFGALLLAIVTIAVVGTGKYGAVIAIAVAFTPSFARFSYSMVLDAVNSEYLAAARIAGVPSGRLFTAYIGRNIADSLIIVAFAALGECVIALASLSFLGLGVQPPDFDWGQMVDSGVRQFYLNPWIALVPAAMITFSGLVLSLLGDSLARVTNPVLWDVRPSWRRRGRQVSRRDARLLKLAKES